MYKGFRRLQKSSEVLYDLWLWIKSPVSITNSMATSPITNCYWQVEGDGGGGFGLHVKWDWSRVQNQ